MKYLTFPQWLLTLCLGSVLYLSQICLQGASSPNVVLIMADDLGIGDITPTHSGCKIQTPQLQRLADEGITFLDAHTTSSVCTPTRYGLLTGRYNWRSRLARGVLSGRSEHLIPQGRPTLAHMLRRAGYHTSMIGKWHLGWDWHKDADGAIDFTRPVLNGPDINGFDRYYAHCGSLDMPPYVWVDTGRVTAVPDREEGVTKAQDRYGWYRQGPIGSDFHIEQVLPHLFEQAMNQIRGHAAGTHNEQPFFLYLALPAPHTPIVPLAPFKGASALNPYADFVMQTDHHVGQLLDTLKETGLEKNTMVLFTSDNGCSPEANFPLLAEHDHHPSGVYRGHKADIFEGGHRVPLIIRWPGKIRPKTQSTHLVCHTDLYPTLEAISGQKPQKQGGEDGFSLLPIFTDQGLSKRDSLISHSIDGSFAIRQGDWKLCLSHGSGGWSAPKEASAKKQGLPALQLYHLGLDVKESHNLVKNYPARARALLSLLKEHVEQGRSTPGPRLSNDRDVQILREGWDPSLIE